MEIGRDWHETWKNQWPAEGDVPQFKETMLHFYQICHELHVHIMRAIALGLGLEGTFFDKKIDQQCHNLRLLAYPPVQTSLLQEKRLARAGAHSDYGTIALLFQDSVSANPLLPRLESDQSAGRRIRSSESAFQRVPACDSNCESS